MSSNTRRRATRLTVGEMWSLFDGQDVLNEVNPRFSENIRRHAAGEPLLNLVHRVPGGPDAEV